MQTEIARLMTLGQKNQLVDSNDEYVCRYAVIVRVLTSTLK